jgi:hypothetical protein
VFPPSARGSRGLAARAAELLDGYLLHDLDPHRTSRFHRAFSLMRSRQQSVSLEAFANGPSVLDPRPG